MLENKKAVIFDLDGTLVDSMWLWPEVDVQYMKKYDLQVPDNFHKEIEGMSYTETAQYFLDTFPSLNCSLDDVRKEWLSMTVELYKTKVILKPGAKEFLDDMKKQGIRLGIATSNARELVDIVLRAQGITDYFSCVCTSCEVAAGKPAPDVYLKVAAALEVDPKNCLVFEDVSNGIRAGKNAGMEVCAVDDSYSLHDEAEKKRLADYYIYNYYDIKNGTYERCKI